MSHDKFQLLGYDFSFCARRCDDVRPILCTYKPVNRQSSSLRVAEKMATVIEKPFEMWPVSLIRVEFGLNQAEESDVFPVKSGRRLTQE
jgi:hypothetical protein